MLFCKIFTSGYTLIFCWDWLWRSPSHNIFITDPLKLPTGREYNLNNVKELKITDEFLTLDKQIIGCQNTESIEECKTREYIDTLMKKCKCLPYSIMMENSKMVFLFAFLISFILIMKLTQIKTVGHQCQVQLKDIFSDHGIRCPMVGVFWSHMVYPMERAQEH